MEGTDALRALAPKWSLAGDDQLLNILQKTHQKIISKCQDVNSKLGEMASALDDASINLQNVNNKFMALSNSQFIESRVYDDDADLTTEIQSVKESVEPPPVDDIAMLKSSISVLERMHETAEILDDSDSDSDAEISVVLKPKDLYSHRPLPYIIGSQPWKNKWHAGLIVEDSDTDSSTSKQDREVDQYSESDTEDVTRPPLEENTLSESSGSLGESIAVCIPAPPPQPTGARPADIAAALARKLATTDTIVQREAVEHRSPAATQPVRKLYKPEVPATSTIFSDEPPPLECDVDDQSSEDDIFAEINKHTPYTQKNTVPSKVTEDLFSFDRPSVEEGDIFSDFAPGRVEQKPGVQQKSTLFEDDSEPELFAEPTSQKVIVQNKDIEKDEANLNTKKPVGGISLFGSNKGTESIGAAILKRNLRKSPTTDEESENDDIKYQSDNIKKPVIENKPKIAPRSNEPESKVSKAADEIDNKSASNKEKDIFEDLFSKSESARKKPSQKIVKEPVKEKVTSIKSKPVTEIEKTNVGDLFNDDIFNDIDDIFTSSVKIPSKESIQNKKSIFDDDDLFTDIDVAKSTNQSSKESKTITGDSKTNRKDIVTSVTDKKSIFDSDDELFSEIKPVQTDKPVTKKVESHAAQDKIFAKEPNDPLPIVSEVQNKKERIEQPTETMHERNLFDDSPQKIIAPKPQTKNKIIFNSDSDDDIFVKIKPDSIKSSSTKDTTMFEAETNENNLAPKEKTLIQSPALFEEDEIDDLFIAANKLKSYNNENKNVETETVHTPLFEKVPEDFTKSNKTDPTPELEITANETKTIPQNTRTYAVKDNVFDDDLLEDNLFSTPKTKYKAETNTGNIPEFIESSQNIPVYKTEKPLVTESKNLFAENPIEDTKSLENQASIPKEIKGSEHKNVGHSVNDDFHDSKREKETLTAESKIPIPNADIFDDILTEPPVFEKPAEPKKSKNINALFDDDSDDESLFFKKNDVIYDEKPEIFSKNANFDIFVTEPPAIDVDFIRKTDKNVEGGETDIDFNTVPKTQILPRSSEVIDKINIFSPLSAKEQNIPQITKNISSDNADKMFSSDSMTKDAHQTEKLDKYDNDDIFKSAPKLEDNDIDGKNQNKEETENNKPALSKEMNTSKPETDIFADIENEDLFAPKTRKPTGKVKIVTSLFDSDEDLFASLPNLPKSDQKGDPSNEIKTNTNKSKTTDDFDDIFKTTESPKKETEVKKIGKLNTKNININVNALLPGASPKKIPKNVDQKPLEQEELSKTIKIIPDETDFQPKTDMKKTEYDVTNQEIANKESKSPKSITFDEKSESGVLDNNVSKQRPRIQVKRRPSSRKARHEAVRRSAIDFSDETDNSSSFDEPKPKDNKRDQNLNKEDNTYKQNENKEQKDVIQKQDEEENRRDDTIESSRYKFDTENINITKEFNNEKEDISESINKNDYLKSNDNVVLNQDLNKTVPFIENREESNQNLNETQKTTTKVVYILNDEDIFNTRPENQEKNIFTNNSKESTDDDDDIFKNKKEIKTLGKTYNENTQKSSEVNKEGNYSKRTIKNVQNKEEISTKEVKPTKIEQPSLFDDSEDELFNKKINTKAKTTIFDSDSEEDLFSGKKSKEKKSKEQKNKEVKKSKEIKKTSLFSDDDDDDLFGGSKKIVTETKQHSVPSTSRGASSAAATVSKTAEPVFSDPLSMLGNDD